MAFCSVEKPKPSFSIRGEICCDTGSMAAMDHNCIPLTMKDGWMVRGLHKSGSNDDLFSLSFFASPVYCDPESSNSTQPILISTSQSYSIKVLG